MWRAPTLRSLIEVLDRVVGRGVVVDSDLPVSPALAGLRAAQAPEEPATNVPAEAEREPDRARGDRRDPATRGPGAMG